MSTESDAVAVADEAETPRVPEGPADDQRRRGLYDRYAVTRVDGRPDPEGARYFVLRYSDDLAAAIAALAYAEAVAAERPALAADLVAELGISRVAAGHESFRLRVAATRSELARRHSEFAARLVRRSS